MNNKIKDAIKNNIQTQRNAWDVDTFGVTVMLNIINTTGLYDKFTPEQFTCLDERSLCGSSSETMFGGFFDDYFIADQVLAIFKEEVDRLSPAAKEKI